MKTQNNTPEKGTNNQPSKQTGGNNPKYPNNDPDQTPEKETADPPVANPNKEKGSIPTPQKKIGFNK